MAKKILSTQNNVSILYPQGFGFGTGSINVKQQLGIGALTYGALIVGAEIIENDPRVFKAVDVEARDNGCGDGREAKIIYSVKNGQRVAHKRSLLRAKLFGGGLVAFASMARTSLWGAELGDSTVLADRQWAAELMRRLGLKHGGHTDNRAAGDNCGCGAIDKYPDITANALAFRQDISHVLNLVLGADAPAYADAIDQVFAVYQAQVDAAEQYFADASGSKTLALLERSGAVIKQLADDHLEDFVVINDVRGQTFHQRQFNEILKERGVVGTAQAFVVDLWLGRDYAALIAKEAARLGFDKKLAQQKALVDFLVRTLATAATLTSGDQPVFYRAASSRLQRLYFLRQLQLQDRLRRSIRLRRSK